MTKRKITIKINFLLLTNINTPCSTTKQDMCVISL